MKKIYIISGVLLLVGAGVANAFFLSNKSNEETKATVSEKTENKIVVEETLSVVKEDPNSEMKTVIAHGEGEDYNWAVMSAVENAVRQTADVSIAGDGLHKIDATDTISHDMHADSNFSATDEVNADIYTRDGVISREQKANGSEKVNANMETNASQTLSHSVKDNSRDINAKYHGVVSSYNVIKHTENNGIHYVDIEAKICKMLPNCDYMTKRCNCYVCKVGYNLVDGECLPCLDNDTCGCTDGKKWSKEQGACIYDAHAYKPKSLVKKSDYSLAIMPFKMGPNINCMGKKVDVKEINTTISNLFIEKLTPSRKFNLVDRNNLDDYAAEMSIIESDMTLPENKVKLQNLAAADYILVGTVDTFTASTSKSFVALTGETNYSSSSKLKISYRILEAATMEVVSVGSSEKTFGKGGAFSSCSSVQQLLLERAIDEAAEKMLIDIFPDYQPKSKVEEQKPAKRAAPAPAPDYSLPL